MDYSNLVNSLYAKTSEDCFRDFSYNPKLAAILSQYVEFDELRWSVVDQDIIETILSQYPGKGTVMERLCFAIEDDKEWVTAKLEEALWPSMKLE